jgi:MFS superfamily sulfate permease-like transporter
MNVNEKMAFRIIALIVILFSIALGLLVGLGKGIAMFLLTWTLFALFQASLEKNAEIWDFYSKTLEKAPAVRLCILIALSGPLAEELILEKERNFVDLVNIFTK